MTNLKYRLLTIVLLVLASVWALYPRTVVERVKRDGAFVFDTVQRVPLKRGLDLVGGMHLTLEIDESKGAVANKAEALDRALTVVRSRIDEFGVAEPLVQKIGNDRIAVELPGIDDPVRATEVVQKSAYLQFQITDKSQAFERNVARLDGILRDKGIVAATKSDTGKAAVKSALPNLFATGDTGKTAAGDSSAADSIKSSNGPFATKVGKAPGGDPGMFMVAETTSRPRSRRASSSSGAPIPSWPATSRIADSTFSTRGRSSPASTSPTPSQTPCRAKGRSSSSS